LEVPRGAAKIHAPQGLCFGCGFWHEKIELARTAADRVVRVNGRHFMIGDEPQPGAYRNGLGHGGFRFVIRFTDGREVTSHNLWGQGEIPERFRDRLPDNARFVND